MTRTLSLLFVTLLLAALTLAFLPTQASLPAQPAATPTFDPARLAQPPTVFPPAQADNGAQIYWGMCMDCHGDRGQGLTEEWRASFPVEQRNCWQAGCHASDFPSNSFMLPETGAPALAGAGTLTRFANALEMQIFIRQNMPLFPPGLLTDKQAWALTAYILRLNGRELNGMSLEEKNGAAVSIHDETPPASRSVAGVLCLTALLGLAVVGLSLQETQQEQAALEEKRLSRRGFLRLALATAWNAFALLAVNALTRYLNFHRRVRSPNVFDIGQTTDYPPDSRLIRPEIPAVIYNRGGEIIAYSLICTHLGCTLEEDARGFVCPCHGSHFDADGQVLAGPAREPLHRLKVEIADNGQMTLFWEKDGK